VAKDGWAVTVLDDGARFWATAAIAIDPRGRIIGNGVFEDNSPRGFVWQIGKMINLGVLGAPGEETRTQAAAISDSGQVVGWSNTRTGDGHAFLWQNGRIRDLGVLHGTRESEAVAINDRDEIVGTSFTEVPVKTPAPPPTPRRGSARTPSTGSAALVSRAFLWRNGTMTDLGTLGGKSAAAVAINARGQIVGWAETKAGVRHAFLWQNGRMLDLGTIPGTKGSTAVAINSRGQITGYSFSKLPDEHAASVDQTLSQLPRAFIWQNGEMTAIDAPGAQFSVAVAINDRGQIIGNALAQNRSSRGFVWQNGHTTYLAVPPGVTVSSARAINPQGDIVGSFAPVRLGGLTHAAVWVNGKLTDIGGDRSCAGDDPHAEASALNEHNQIVGMCGAMMASTHALLWTQR
jgi:probable HAF family extracellular repeat protein